MEESLMESSEVTVMPPSRIRKFLRTSAWVFLSIVCLCFFTIVKLPEDRIKAYLHGQITTFLAPLGIGLNMDESKLSIWFGITYSMKNVTLTFPSVQTPTRIEKVAFSPSLLPLLLRRMGGKLRLENEGGRFDADGWTKDTHIGLNFTSKSLDVGKLGLLPALAGLNGSTTVSGSGSMDGNLADPSSISGEVKLDLSKIILEQQSVMGFSVPRLSISGAKVVLEADKAMVMIKTMELGKAGGTDDIVANITGSLTLGRQWESSTLNLKTRFSLSQNVMKSFALLDALLSAGKTGEGSYAFSMNGSLYSPVPTPLENQGGS
jgi:type II secretion system protein N